MKRWFRIYFFRQFSCKVQIASGASLSGAWVKWLWLALLFISPQFVVSQSRNKETIDRWVSEYCNCVVKATTKSEVDLCKIEGDTVILRSNEYDSFYLLRKMMRECGESNKRFDGEPTDLIGADNLLFKTCTYFRENDLKKFKLKQKLTSFFETMRMIETWEPSEKKSEQTVLQFIQSRMILDSLDSTTNSQLKEYALLKKQDSTINHPIFDFLAIADSKDPLGVRYSIIATKGKLLCSLVILLKEKNPSIIDQFLAILEDKVRNCDF